jgi:hypothetical protein
MVDIFFSVGAGSFAGYKEIDLKVCRQLMSAVEKTPNVQAKNADTALAPATISQSHSYYTSVRRTRDVLPLTFPFDLSNYFSSTFSLTSCSKHGTPHDSTSGFGFGAWSLFE